jgi:hypothetical protein
MARKKTDEPTPEPKDEAPAEQPAPEPGRQQVQLRIDQSRMETSYANQFRANATAEEVMLDFGMQTVGPPTGPEAQAQVLFQATQRIILSHYSAKRLALAMGQIVRQHEAQFGDLELDVAKRRKQP